MWRMGSYQLPDRQTERKETGGKKIGILNETYTQHLQYLSYGSRFMHNELSDLTVAMSSVIFRLQ
jgi:hypothetical protein